MIKKRYRLKPAMRKGRGWRNQPQACRCLSQCSYRGTHNSQQVCDNTTHAKCCQPGKLTCAVVSRVLSGLSCSPGGTPTRQRTAKIASELPAARRGAWNSFSQPASETSPANTSSSASRPVRQILLCKPPGPPSKPTQLGCLLQGPRLGQMLFLISSFLPV